jgi:hypothetical protein
MNVSVEQLTELGSIELRWPVEGALRRQMAEFIEQVASPSPAHEAFLGSFVEDLDGEGTSREDLAELAAARLAVWGEDGDAVARTLELFQWLCRDVLPSVFPELRLSPVRGIEDVYAVMTDLADPATVAGDEWHERYQEDKAGSGREWARYQVLSEAHSAAKYLAYLPRRLNPKKFKPKVRYGDRPRDACERAAASCGAAFVYAAQLKPAVVRALDRLADARYSPTGIGMRAREALHQAGITRFGPRLEAFAISLVEAYDQAAVTDGIAAGEAVAIAEAALPKDRHEAVLMLAESPQLSDRPLPADAQSFADAAWGVLVRASAEVGTHLHSLSARAQP